MAAAASGRTARTTLRPLLQHRRHATDAPPGPREHPQAPAGACRRLQSRAPDAPDLPLRDPEGVLRAPFFASSGSVRVCSRFAGLLPVVRCGRRWSIHGWPERAYGRHGLAGNRVLQRAARGLPLFHDHLRNPLAPNDFPDATCPLLLAPRIVRFCSLHLSAFAIPPTDAQPPAILNRPNIIGRSLSGSKSGRIQINESGEFNRDTDTDIDFDCSYDLH